MLFEDRHGEAVSRLKEAFAERTRGDLIQWDEVSSVIGYTRESDEFWTIVNRFRKSLLREREIATRAAKDVGIRLLTIRETLEEVPVHRSRRAFRQANMGLAELRTVAASSLSDKQRLAFTIHERNLKETRHKAFRAKKAAVLASVLRREGMPRVSRPPR